MSNLSFSSQIKYQRRFTFTLRHFTFCVSETFKRDRKNTEIIKKKHNPRDKLQQGKNI